MLPVLQSTTATGNEDGQGENEAWKRTVLGGGLMLMSDFVFLSGSVFTSGSPFGGNLLCRSFEMRSGGEAFIYELKQY